VSNFLANLVKFLRRKFTIFSYFKIISTFNFQIRFFPQFVRNAGIAITFLVINLSTLLRQVFWAFLCLKWKNRTFSGSMITTSYNLEINQQLKLMLLAK
jgi:hypothetical protein